LRILNYIKHHYDMQFWVGAAIVMVLMMASDACGFDQSLRAQRERPNDFWYNWQMGDGDYADGYSSGSCNTFVPSPTSEHQWHMGDAYLNLERAWAITKGDPGGIVVVLDTEFQTWHPELEPRLWTNPGEIWNDIDDDGNGLIDDVNGWDFANWSPYLQVRPGAEYVDCYRAGGSTQHGTNMASIICSATNNEAWAEDFDPDNPATWPNLTDRRAGAASITWHSKLLPLKFNQHQAFGGHMPDAGCVPSNTAVEAEKRGKPSEATTFRSYTSGMDEYAYIEWLVDQGYKILVVSQSTTSGETPMLARMLMMLDIPMAMGAGNADREDASEILDYIDNTVIAGAVGRDYQRWWSYGCISGVNKSGASYGTGVDVLGYSGTLGLSYVGTVGSFDQMFRVPGSNRNDQIWLAGWWRSDEVTALDQDYWYDGEEWHQYAPNLNFCGQDSTSEYLAEMVPVAIPSGIMTSGATAEAAGVMALIRSAYDVGGAQAVGMLQRGCVSVDAYNSTVSGGVDRCGTTCVDDLSVYTEPCDGLLGVGRMDAYRSLTLWGAVPRDTTLTGNVYVAGDVYIPSGVTVTLADNCVLHVAPDNVWQDTLGPYLNGFPWVPETQYQFTYPAWTTAYNDPQRVGIYVDGSLARVEATAEVVADSWASTQLASDWLGILVGVSGYTNLVAQNLGYAEHGIVNAP
jgi:hypothetical protein